MSCQLTSPAARPVAAGRPPSSLLGFGVVAGPLYVTVALAQALTREGFDLARHPWSFLANGDLGWIQTANFAVTALATIACAVGLRAACPRDAARGGRRAWWARSGRA